VTQDRVWTEVSRTVAFLRDFDSFRGNGLD
jgi:hypothetical protein